MIMQINERWNITLLNKKQLYRNEEVFPSFDYIAKGIKKRVEKIIKLNDVKYKTFRNMIPNLINLKDKNKGNSITNLFLLEFIL